MDEIPHGILVKRKVNDLIPYENNPRNNDEAVDAVVNSIREYGYNNYISIDSHNVIVAGHTRRLALLKLGYGDTDVPVILLECSESKLQAYRIADNQTGNIATWELDKLQAELLDLQSKEENLDFLGFGDKLNMFLGGPENEARKEGETDADDSPEPEELDEMSESKPGEMYSLGSHRLICGDATDPVALSSLLSGDETKPMMWMTDPPYNVDYTGRTHDRLKIESDKMDDSQFRQFLSSAFGNIVPRLEKGCSFYIFYAGWETVNFHLALKDNDVKVREILIWVKDRISLSWSKYMFRHEPVLYGWTEGAAPKWYTDRKQTTVLEFDRPNRNIEHPTMKPIDLLEYLLGNSSKKGDIVLDTFGGSGSTLIACERLGRVCRMMELAPRYCDVIRKRWAEYVHGKDCDWVSLTPKVMPCQTVK